MVVWITAGAVVGALGLGGALVSSRRRLAASLIENESLERAYADAIVSRDEARLAESARGRMLATVSHELRSPLNGVIGMADLLASSPLSDDQFEQLEVVRASGSLMQALVEQLFDVSVMAEGELSLRHEPFDLLRACEEAVQLTAPRVAAKKLDTTLRWAPEVPRAVVGDGPRIRQLLLNLLSNAVKFTEEGGVVLRVAVAEERPGRAVVRFEIRDTGPGIPFDEQEAIFGAFVQGTSRSPGRGAGLGLSIVRGIAEQMGGEVSVHSVVGEGSTFRLTLPFDLDSVGTATVRARLTGLELAVVEPGAEDRAAWEDLVAAHGGLAHCFPSVDALFGHLDHAPALLSVAVQEGLETPRLLRRIRQRWRHVPLVLSAPFGWRPGPELGAWELPIIRRPLLPSTLGARLARYASVEFKPPRSSVRLLGPLSVKGAAKVLLVDDSPLTRRMTATALRQGGYAVSLAVNGFEAVDQVLTGDFSVVLMDVAMPGMSGMEAVARIRELEEPGKRTPIIAITGTALPEEAERYLEQGLDGLLIKPLAPEAIRAEVLKWTGDAEDTAVSSY